MSKELTPLKALNNIRNLAENDVQYASKIPSIDNELSIIEEALRKLEKLEKVEITSALVDQFKSKRTYIAIYGCQLEICGERLFIIKSNDLKTGIDYIRFGNRTQAKSIINTYRKEKRFELK